MSINSKEDANKYYHVVNNLVDDYIDKWKIKPSNLKKYLKKGSAKMQKFVERNGLSDINGISRILDDVIEDRVHMEKDGILTFESFKVFESDEYKVSSVLQSLYKGIDKADIKMEKLLADHFDANLSDIDIVDADKHIFRVSNWDENDVLVIIYSKEEYDIIKTNIKDFLLNELVKKQVDLMGIDIRLENIINKDKFEELIDGLNDGKINELITTSLKNEGNFKLTKKNDYYLWIENK
jgi:hypothetical protein